jgi:2-amino-4-hydroxy-6-hydroxymethyldihydropteridine diphosphokinase
MLSEQYDITIEKCSNVYETEPQNLKDQPYFLNCAIKIKTGLLPSKLLEMCQQIESAIGRNQTIRFGPRNIDIDILTFNEECIDSPKLTIPHPRMFERNFVLIPLREICEAEKLYGHELSFFIQKNSNQQVSMFCKRTDINIGHSGVNKRNANHFKD